MCQKTSWDGGSPYYCGRPPSAPHARHNGSLDQQFYSLDTALSYRCLPGYTGQQGGFSTSKCFFHNGTAIWSVVTNLPDCLNILVFLIRSSRSS